MDELKLQISELKETLLDLVCTHDELMYHICFFLGNEYNRRIGTLEYDVKVYTLDVLKIRRKIMLAKRSLQEKETVDELSIELEVDREFAGYDGQVEFAPKIFEDRDYSNLEKLKEYYRNIMRKVHPVINPNNFENKQDYYSQAVNAYRNGNLDALRNLDYICFLLDGREPDNGDAGELERRRNELENASSSLKRKIYQIQTSFPYNQYELLSDKKQLAYRIEGLNNKIAFLKQEYEYYLEEYRKSVCEG